MRRIGEYAKYFDIQTIYTELYLDSTLIERLAGITEAPDYVFYRSKGINMTVKDQH
jgi:hypothetical protein